MITLENSLNFNKIIKNKQEICYKQEINFHKNMLKKKKAKIQVKLKLYQKAMIYRYKNLLK